MTIEMVNLMQDKTVFIVDANESVRCAIDRLLRAAGFATQSFPSTEALLATDDLSPGLCVIADVELAKASSLLLHEQLKQRGSCLPVILMSASDDDALRNEARAQGIAAFLSKPVDGQALLDTIAWVSHASEGAG